MNEHAVRIFISEEAFNWLKAEAKRNKRRPGPHVASVVEQMYEQSKSEQENAA